jgi:hypothetical protein
VAIAARREELLEQQAAGEIVLDNQRFHVISPLMQ